MPIRLDPEQSEVAAMAEVLPDLAGARVLEIGCGDGRLTCRYAHRVGSVLAVDPDEAALATFRETMPAALSTRVELRRSELADLRLPDAAFDLVLFSWSL
jgi:ubiquinone/menaquinone biosynthesis C-methylase UbiE